MKKYLVTLFLMLLSACMLAGCNTKTDVQNNTQKEDTKQESENETENSEIMSEEEDDFALDEMKQKEVDDAIAAVEEYVENYGEDIGECKFIYVNGDHIPEFYYCAYGNGVLLVYHEGEIIEHFVHSSSGSFSYIEKQNLVWISEGRMDMYSDAVYNIRGGEFEMLALGYYGLEDNTEIYDEEGNPIPYTYEWNGTDVTEEEYEKALSQTFDMNMGKDIYYECYDSFEEACENFGVDKYEADSCDVYTFEMTGNVLKVKADAAEPFEIEYPVSSNCVWYRCYVGTEDQISEVLSFEEIKDILEGHREQMKEGFYTCWNGFVVKVKNNEVIAVYIIAQ